MLDPAPPRRLDAARLEVLAGDDAATIVRSLVHAPVTAASLQTRGLLAPSDLARGLATLRQAGDWYFADEWLDETRRRARERLAERAASHPLDPGVPLAELLPPEPWAQAIVPLLAFERRGAKLYLPGRAPTLAAAAGVEELRARLAEEDVVRVTDRDLAGLLEAEGALKRVGDGYAVSAQLYERGRAALHAIAPITLARFRDELGVSRKTAQLLLERFDADGLTRRIGDERVLRRRGAVDSA